MKTKKADVKTIKRQISLLKVKFKELKKGKKDTSSDDDADVDKGPQTDAGNHQLGGAMERKRKKGDKG